GENSGHPGRAAQRISDGVPGGGAALRGGGVLPGRHGGTAAQRRRGGPARGGHRGRPPARPRPGRHGRPALAAGAGRRLARPGQTGDAGARVRADHAGRGRAGDGSSAARDGAVRAQRVARGLVLAPLGLPRLARWSTSRIGWGSRSRGARRSTCSVAVSREMRFPYDTYTGLTPSWVRRARPATTPSTRMRDYAPRSGGGVSDVPTNSVLPTPSAGRP